jgi:hypothetical protein
LLAQHVAHQLAEQAHIVAQPVDWHRARDGHERKYALSPQQAARTQPVLDRRPIVTFAAINMGWLP